MAPLTALLVALAAGPGALVLHPLAAPEPAPGSPRPPALASLEDVEVARATPPCSGDVCQPRVAVPGHEPRYSTRGRRTDLVLSLLDRANVEPIATVVRVLASTGVRIDYTPPQLDASSPGARATHVQVLVRWRLDALNRPAWLEPGPG